VSTTSKARSSNSARQSPVDRSTPSRPWYSLADHSADAAVASLVLCSVPDQDGALAELHRIIRPGGELRFYEHVIANCQPKRLLLQTADHSGLWPRIAGGCHPARDTTAAIARAGFNIESSQRLTFATARFEPSIPYVLGIARRA